MVLSGCGLIIASTICIRLKRVRRRRVKRIIRDMIVNGVITFAKYVLSITTYDKSIDLPRKNPPYNVTKMGKNAQIAFFAKEIRYLQCYPKDLEGTGVSR